MYTSISRHGAARGQQRAIPPIVDHWLDEFGDQAYDGHGAVRVYFSHRSVAAMEKSLGSHFVRQNGKYLRTYKVVSGDGYTITIGWRRYRIRKK